LTAGVLGLSPSEGMDVFCYGCVVKVAASVKGSPLVHRGDLLGMCSVCDLESLSA